MVGPKYVLCSLEIFQLTWDPKNTGMLAKSWETWLFHGWHISVNYRYVNWKLQAQLKQSVGLAWSTVGSCSGSFLDAHLERTPGLDRILEHTHIYLRERRGVC